MTRFLVTAQRHSVILESEMSDQSIPAGFRALPPQEQCRVRESSRAILEMAFRHTGAIIISSAPSSSASLNSASCFLLDLEGRIFLATAEHVLAETENRLSTEPSVKWQVGQLYSLA